MDVTACPRCASLDIRAASMSDGVFAGGGELLLRVCHDCGFRGSALSFATEAEYETFRQEVVAGANDPPWVPVGEDGHAFPEAAVAADSEGGEEPEEVPAEVEAVMDLPHFRRPTWSSIGLAAIGVFPLVGGAAVLVLTAAGLVLGPGSVGGGLTGRSTIDAGTILISLVTGFLWLGIGIAFLRVARRMWVKSQLG